MFKQHARHDSQVFVAGHQRPDADASVSACIAARLRARLDRDRTYTPILLGEANQQTRWIFQQAGIPLPELRDDIRFTVGEMMNRDFAKVRPSDHLAEAVECLHRASGSLVPVVAADGTLAGVLSDRLPQSRYFYNFNAEDYLGQLLHLPDVVSALRLKPLRRKQPSAGSAPGCFRIASTSVAMAREAWTPGDVVLCGLQPEMMQLAAEKMVSAVIFADCEFEEARTIASAHAGLPAFHFNGSLMSLVAQLPMAIPVSVIMDRDCRKVTADELIDDVRDLVAHTPHALPVVDSAGKLIGTLSRADLLDEHRRFLILVDHFERTQSVLGIEQAEILEIIDHHRVGNIETTQPVRVDCRPLGSTASILAAKFSEAGLKPSRGEALLMLGALISDTLLLTSPTTTASDLALANNLAKLAKVNLEEFGREVLRQNDELATAHPDALVEKDLKEFQHGGTRFAAAQIETVDLAIMTPERRDALAASIGKARERLGVAFAVLMVTDVFKSESHLLISDRDAARAPLLLGGSVNGAGRRFAGMVSRKKQLLPMLLENLDAFGKNSAAR